MSNSEKLIISENTATMFLHQPDKTQPTFNYNTTIVDLNPFKKASNAHAYSASSLAPASGNLVNAPFDLLRTSSLTSAPVSALFASVPIAGSNNSNKFDERMFNKIMREKKFLINKSMRFYEPVKDAEMLVQLDLLRSKLQAEKLSLKNYSIISRSKTSLFEKADSEYPISNPRNSIIYSHSNLNSQPNRMARNNLESPANNYG